MADQIGFSNAMKEVVGNNFVTLDELKNDNEIYIPLFKNKDGSTEGKKILGKLLAQNGGGGSSDSSMPKNVIVINPDVAEVEGKVYNTFANAKSYMEAHSTDKFCVELPAGDFGTNANDEVFLSEQWMVHGNNTTIVGGIHTSITIEDLEDSFLRHPQLTDCIIKTTGFVTEGTEEYFNIQNCTIYRFGDSADSPVFDLFDCIIDNYHNKDFSGDLARNTEFSTHYYICSNCKVYSIVNFSHLILNSCTIGGWGEYVDISQRESDYDEDEDFIYVSSCCGLGEGINFNMQRAHAIFANCNFECGECFFQFDNRKEKIQAYNCRFFGVLKMTAEWFLKNCEVELGDTGDEKDINLNVLYLEHTEFNLCKRSIDCYALLAACNSIVYYYDGGDIVYLYADATSDIPMGNVSITGERQMIKNIMFSTDGGSTMTLEETDATHYGVLKDIGAHQYISINGVGVPVPTADYMWFPISNS